MVAKNCMKLLNIKTFSTYISLFGGCCNECLSLCFVALLGRSLLCQCCSLVGLTVLFSFLCHASLVRSMTIKVLKSDNGSQWVALLFISFRLGLGWVENRLNFIGVDNTCKVGVGHRCSGNALSIISVDLIQ